MRDLVQAELVRPISPAQYIYNVPNFENVFVKHVERYFLRTHTGAASKYSLIHVEKLGLLPDFLQQNRLAFLKEGPWYFVRTDVAEHFMAYLASVLARQDEISASPITSEQSSIRLFRRDYKNFRSNPPQKYEPLRDVVLQGLLPVPAQNATVDDLVEFKSQYGHLLPLFRNYVERNVVQLSQLPNQEERDYAVKLFLEGAQAQSQELVEAMKIQWGKIAFGTLAPIFVAGLGLSVNDTDNVPNIVTVGAATNLASAIYQAISGIPQNRRASTDTPLAYVVHMQRKFV